MAVGDAAPTMTLTLCYNRAVGVALSGIREGVVFEQMGFIRTSLVSWILEISNWLRILAILLANYHWMGYQSGMKSKGGGQKPVPVCLPPVFARGPGSWTLSLIGWWTNRRFGVYKPQLRVVTSYYSERESCRPLVKTGGKTWPPYHRKAYR